MSRILLILTLSYSPLLFIWRCRTRRILLFVIELQYPLFSLCRCRTGRILLFVIELQHPLFFLCRCRTGRILILSLSYNTLSYLSAGVEQERYFFSRWATTLSLLFSQVSNRKLLLSVVELQHPPVSLLRCRTGRLLLFVIEPQHPLFCFCRCRTGRILLLSLSYNTLSYLSAGAEQEGYFLLSLSYNTLSSVFAGVEQGGVQTRLRRRHRARHVQLAHRHRAAHRRGTGSIVHCLSDSHHDMHKRYIFSSNLLSLNGRLFLATTDLC